MERKSAVTFKGNPLTLLGKEINVGEKAPNFSVVDETLKDFSLKDFAGKIKLISVTPSLDTPVCDLQARSFENRATNFSDDVVFLNISVDLPFAIARFCKSNNITKIKTFSDYKERNFGETYGVLIKELQLLARAVFIIDKNDIVRYVEIVPEVTNEPNYENAIKELKKILEQ
ncbi:MAG: thiol peroxidase [Acidobacteria bacterium]|nr:thiol peroxidase [Acidobacteriota bacterium]